MKTNPKWVEKQIDKMAENPDGYALIVETVHARAILLKTQGSVMCFATGEHWDLCLKPSGAGTQRITLVRPK